MTVLRIEKSCPVCQTVFSVPPSLGHTICCSKACADQYQARNRPVRVCQHCGTEYTGPPSKNRIYCSRACSEAARQGKPKPNARKRVQKTCPQCGKRFEVPISRAGEATYCSLACFHASLRNRARDLSDEARARMTGRPRVSVDETRTCPVCGTDFLVRSTSPKIYCSRECGGLARRGQGDQSKQLLKTCPVCGAKFRVSPSLAGRMCCSTACAGAHKRGAALTVVRKMSDAEAAWFAGLFDGEGSVVLRQRKRPGGGSPAITLTNTVGPLLERAHEVTGVGSITRHQRADNLRAQEIFTWQIGGEQAKEILRQIRPWLIAKAERADAVLAGETFARQSRWDHVYPEPVPEETAPPDEPDAAVAVLF